MIKLTGLLITLLVVGCGTVEYSDTRTERGPKGNPGNDGEVGDTGETGPQGEAGVDGVDGTQGEQGEAGTDGTDGSDGTNGVDGTDGRDAISVVSLYANSNGYANNTVTLPSKRRFAVPAKLMAYSTGSSEVLVTLGSRECTYRDGDLDETTCTVGQRVRTRTVSVEIVSYTGTYFYVTTQLYFD